MSDLEFDDNWFHNNTKSDTSILNIVVAFKYEKSARKLMRTFGTYDFGLKYLLTNKYYDAAILKMKLNHEYQLENNTYICENRKWPLYIDTSTDPVHINEMFNITEINPGTYLNLIVHPRAYEFNFINLFDAKALARQLVESDNINKILDICFSSNIDKIAAYFFEYLSKKSIIIYISVHIPKIHIFIKRLISTELSFDTLTIYVSMISNFFNYAPREDKTIMLSLINNNISITKHIIATNLINIFNDQLFLINTILSETIGSIIEHDKILFLNKISDDKIMDEH